MRGHQPFNYDVTSNGRYIYTGSQARISSISANKSQSDMVAKAIQSLKIDSILDLGCGDGSYTHEFLSLGLKNIVGLDPAAKAIDFARKNFEAKNLKFTNSTVDSLIKSKSTFDCVVLRGVLHHCDDPEYVLKQATKLGRSIIILEPNGLNPILKIIEKASPYHRAHSERSFSRFKIKKWIKHSKFEIVKTEVGVLVPFFFPNSLVSIFEKLEIYVRKISIVNWIFCGTQCIVAIAPDSNHSGHESITT